MEDISIKSSKSRKVNEDSARNLARVSMMENSRHPIKDKKAVEKTAVNKEYKHIKKNTLHKEKTSNNVFSKFMIFVLIVIAIVFVCMSDGFNVSEIIVEGNTYISDEQIISFSKIEKGTNIFALSMQDISNKVKENPYVDDAQVKRKFPNKILICIDEREKAFAMQLANSYVCINNQGYVLEITNQAPSIPLVLGFSTDLTNIQERDRINEDDLTKMNIIIKIMEIAKKNEIDSLITQIDVSDSENYAIYLQSENKIAYLGNGSELNTRFLYIKAILKKQQGKSGKIFVNMDLNAEEYVYFREEEI